MDNSREDFQQRLRSWFQSKGIIGKLVLFLRSQMFIELRNNSSKVVGAPENDNVSPKFQAVKLLIADFLLQENLLFALSVFCSEVPVLMNFKRYANYISQLADVQTYVNNQPKQPKPKFSKNEIHDILEAFDFRLSKDERCVVYEMYESDKFSSLLFCLLYLLPMLLRKNRHLQKTFLKVKKKEKYFKKLIRLEKNKVKRMYSLIHNTHGVVLKHKTELNNALQRQNELQHHSSIMNEKLTELLKKETELNNKEDYLISKEKDFEKLYQARIQDIEEKSIALVEKDRHLQKNFEKLAEKQEAFNYEKDRWIEKTGQIYSTRTYETEKLQEYEQKFRTLQEEVYEILKQCRDVQHNRNLEVDKSDHKEMQCRFDFINQSQQTEAGATTNLDEYVNLMKNENALLKSSSFKQQQYIAQLSAELVFLRNRLDYLEKDLQIKTQYEKRKEMNKVAEKLYSPKFLHSDKDTSVFNLKIRKTLFPDKESPSSSEFTSSNSKEDVSLTDELVAEAKNKLKQLESESEALNKNFKNLQTVLTKNIVFNEETSTSASSSDKFSRRHGLLTSNFADSDSNLESSPDFKNRSFFSRVNESVSQLNENLSPNRSAPFKKLYLKYKQIKRKEPFVNLDNEQLKSFTDEVKVDYDNEVTKEILAQNLNENSNSDKEIKKNIADYSVKDEDMNTKEGNANDGSREPNQKEISISNESASIRSVDSSFKLEGDISVASKDSKSSSDFWK